MIVCAGFIQVAPENADTAKDLIAPLVTSTQAEAGNLHYSFSTSIDTPGKFEVFEEWADEESMGAHMSSDHMANFLVGIGALVTGSNVDRYDVTNKTKLL